MSKITSVQAYLNQEHLDLAIFSNPTTIHYLTGFASDPHERHMMLFILPDAESLLFLPALDVERARATVNFPVVGTRMPKTLGN